MEHHDNKYPAWIWEFLRRFPAFRYLKNPVDNVSQLYVKYPDGQENGVYAYVTEKNCFYGWDSVGNRWKAIGGETIINGNGEELVTLDALSGCINLINGLTEKLDTHAKSETVYQAAFTQYIDSLQKQIDELKDLLENKIEFQGKDDYNDDYNDDYSSGDGTEEIRQLIQDELSSVTITIKATEI